MEEKETVSIASSGAASANSDDFELLSAPASPPELLNMPQPAIKSSVKLDSTTDIPGRKQKLDIANNGNLADLHKQMNEVGESMIQCIFIF